MNYIRKQFKVNAIQWKPGVKVANMIVDCSTHCVVKTNNGTELLKNGDFFITTENGETFCCKEEEFYKDYEKLDE